MAAKSSTLPRWKATGPLPGPLAHKRSRIRRPGSGGALTTSKAVPQGRALGEAGRCVHSACTLAGRLQAEASQSAPARVTQDAPGVGAHMEPWGAGSEVSPKTPGSPAGWGR
ncbi:hypothetical protein DB35_27755 [Streptomyces abyssalis]|uniref:Uncharacterized protein n=1 Tax=Streptomyces abyssalis TaxID=933944 RepID=A0A1E7JJJ0_9ACTN|nr:hypothetical protein DB35_27755 [Streptomyces abyssalis]OEU87789.1 hypothetical protein AN215_15835 [Streptomyces abyssalis]